jgi:lipopolysaccharide exporter
MPMAETLKPVLQSAGLPGIASGMRSRLILLGKRWSFARDVATLGAGTGAAQIFTIASAPVITRLYTPNDLGVLGLFTSFLSVATVATSLKYELGIVSAADEQQAADLTCVSMLLSLPLSIVAGGFFSAAIRLGWLGFHDIPGYAALLMIPALVLTGIFAALRYWMIRRERFGLISQTFVAQQATRSISQIILGTLHTGDGGLLIGELIGRAIGVQSMLRQAWPALRKGFLSNPYREKLRVLRTNFKLPVYSLPSSLIDALAANMTLPLLVQLYGSRAGGHFALLQKVLAVPLGLIAFSVADAFHSRLARCARQDPEQMLSLFRRTSAGLFIIGFLPTLALGLIGPQLFAFVFGEQWAAAGTMAALCAPWFLAQFVVSPLSRLVFVLRGQESKLIYDIVLLVSIFLVYTSAVSRGWPLLQTVWAFTLVNTGSYVLYYFILHRIVAKSTPATIPAAPLS